MTKEELIAKLKELGLSGIDGLKDEALEKLKKYLDEQKAQLDTETRRKVRAVWIVFTVAGVALGGLAGWFLRGLVG
ncbi:putative uncharacterized protein [Sutterella wadsworthensis CAG:135]|uniref:hypothetical protein n=1 Tax=Sutterella wadsworthensis TaxID=40545 RepID=UPI00033CADF5|nr:putative uncharacterized protein [Sutterella wadsworthensis CAG:135]